MSTEKISNNVLAPNFAFGELSREEINTVLTQAGVSLLPPKRIPFATGVRRKRKSKETVERVDDKKSEHVVPNGVTSPKEKSGKSNGHTLSLEEPAQNDATSTREDQTATETPTEIPVASPVKSKPSSWAALLRTPADETKQKSKMPGPAAPSSTPKPNVSAATPQAQTTPPKFVGIADIISRYEAQFDAPLLEPRGLINNVNTCFMNVILQPLSHCPPFYNLIKTIGQHVVHSFRSKTPLLDSLIEFINEFRLDTTAPNDVNPEPYGEPFVPEYVYDALRGQKRFDSLKGRQEDAEEFLCFLLDGLHEEMVAFLKEKEDPEKKGAAAQNGSANGWLEVGPKNKTSSLQTTGFEESPISKIFGGKMRSILRCPGAKDSVNLEPFQSLPLDIQPEGVKTVEDAMGNITVPEVMHDFMSPKNVRVEATKQVYLESLPPVLILHMKRFVFDNVGGVQKLQKPVQYGAELVIQPEWMTPVLRSGSPIKYRLFGIVYHHGASAGGGHYTCDIRRQNGEWLHINDTNITPVSEQDVLLTDHNTRTSEMIHADQTAYILFYTRA